MSRSFAATAVIPLPAQGSSTLLPRAGPRRRARRATGCPTASRPSLHDMGGGRAAGPPHTARSAEAYDPGDASASTDRHGHCASPIGWIAVPTVSRRKAPCGPDMDLTEVGLLTQFDRPRPGQLEACAEDRSSPQRDFGWDLALRRSVWQEACERRPRWRLGQQPQDAFPCVRDSIQLAPGRQVDGGGLETLGVVIEQRQAGPEELGDVNVVVGFHRGAEQLGLTSGKHVMAKQRPRLSGGISRPLEWESDPMTMARRIASGSREASLQRQLPGIDLRRPFGTVQGVDVAPVQQMNAYAADKREQIGHCLLPGVRQSQQQERDQRDGDLNAHRVLGGADEALDLQTLLDPAEDHSICQRCL